jgi:hypothetical protein
MPEEALDGVAQLSDAEQQAADAIARELGVPLGEVLAGPIGSGMTSDTVGQIVEPEVQRPPAPKPQELPVKALKQLVAEAHEHCSIFEQLVTRLEGHASYVGGFGVAQMHEEKVGHAGLAGNLQDALERFNAAMLRLAHVDLWLQTSIHGEGNQQGGVSGGPVSG